MQIYHNSHDENYRKPFGAVKTESEITLGIKVTEAIPDRVSVRCWFKDHEIVHEMAQDEARHDNLYKVTLKMPSSPVLFWYYFIIEVQGKTFYYSNNSHLGGVGETTESPTNNSFQITFLQKLLKIVLFVFFSKK